MTSQAATVALVVDTGAPQLFPVLFVDFSPASAPLLRHAAALVGERLAVVQLNGMDAAHARYTVQAWITSLEANADNLQAQHSADTYNVLLGDLYLLRDALAFHTKTRVRAY